MEHKYHLDAATRFSANDRVIGYQYGAVVYTADELIGGSVTNAFGTQSGRLYRSDCATTVRTTAIWA